MAGWPVRPWTQVTWAPVGDEPPVLATLLTALWGQEPLSGEINNRLNWICRGPGRGSVIVGRGTVCVRVSQCHVCSVAGISIGQQSQGW